MADPPSSWSKGSTDQTSSGSNVDGHASQHSAERILRLCALAAGSQSENRQLSVLQRSPTPLQGTQSTVPARSDCRQAGILRIMQDPCSPDSCSTGCIFPNWQAPGG